MHLFLHHFYDIWLDMAPWLFAGFVLAFVCSYFLSERWIRKHLGGAGWMPIVKASFLGLPLPICSCGVLLVALALRRSGARKAPVCAFLASTPQSGTDALLVSIPLLGTFLTCFRFVSACVSGLVAGAMVRWFGIAQPPPMETEDLTDNCAAVCACHHHDHDHPHNHGETHHHEFANPRTRCLDALRYAFIHLPGEIAILLTIGVAIAAAITTFLPEHFLSGLPLWMAYGLAIVIGLPTYSCSLAIVPIAAGLIGGGLTPGAAFLFMVCAPTTHLGALFVMAKELGVRTAVLYVLAIVLCGLGFALCLDFAIPDFLLGDFTATHPVHEHSHATVAERLFLLPVIFLFVHGLIYRTCHHWKHSRHH